MIAKTSLIHAIIKLYIKLELDYTSDHKTIYTTIIFDGYHRNIKVYTQSPLDEIVKKSSSFVWIGQRTWLRKN